jgi:integrase
VDNNQHTFLKLIRQYITLRPQHTKHTRFFVFYRNNKCSTNPVGINTFAKIPCTVAQFLKLDQPQLYTGHCFRRSSASILSDSGADFAAIKRLGGWKSTSVAEANIEDSIQNKVNIAKQLFAQTRQPLLPKPQVTST